MLREIIKTNKGFITENTKEKVTDNYKVIYWAY